MDQKPTIFGLQYRLAQEAIPSFLPCALLPSFLVSPSSYVVIRYIKSRIVELPLNDFKVVLAEHDPYTSKLSQAAQDLLRPLGTRYLSRCALFCF